jgi:LuxR family maltose regulon positive regulatory protein
MEQLLRKLAVEQSSQKVRGDHSEYIARILDSFPRGTPMAHLQAGRQSHLVESLTPREMDVLRLLAEGLSNREIAARLYLSPNTLRVYTTNLYAKLDVHTRARAVRRAQELNLI